MEMIFFIILLYLGDYKITVVWLDNSPTLYMSTIDCVDNLWLVDTVWLVLSVICFFTVYFLESFPQVQHLSLTFLGQFWYYYDNFSSIWWSRLDLSFLSWLILFFYYDWYLSCLNFDAFPGLRVLNCLIELFFVEKTLPKFSFFFCILSFYCSTSIKVFVLVFFEDFWCMMEVEWLWDVLLAIWRDRVWLCALWLWVMVFYSS